MFFLESQIFKTSFYSKKVFKNSFSLENIGKLVEKDGNYTEDRP